MHLPRQHRRHRVADLHGTLQFAHPAVVLDLSRSGIAVESAERLAPGRIYPLQLEGQDGLLITTSARVVWCKLTGTVENEDGEAAPVFRAGLEFQGALPEAASRLFDRLEEHASRRRRHPSAGALQAERPGVDAVAARAVDVRRADP